MLPTFFPTPEVAPVNPPFVASPKLGGVPALSEQDALFLQKLIERLRQGDSDDEEEDDADTIENGNGNDDAEEDLGLGSSPHSSLNTRVSGAAAAKRKSTLSRTSSVKIPRLDRKKNVTIVSRVSPDKPANDKNDYRVITLSNGLRAILIRKPFDPENNHTDPVEDFTRSLSSAKKKQKTFLEERMLPENFPENFPFANLPMAPVLTEIIQKEVDKEMTRCYPAATLNDYVARLKKNERKQCIFAVSVNVGSCDNPWNCLGLAHFVEHMVHYGSEKYPGEETYFSFTINHGDTFNAFTQNHTTTYYSSLPIERASEGMDMLASMLSKPIFENDMTVREVNAVDSEFNMRRHIDFLRRWHLLQLALGDHPLGKYGCGNENTLLEPKNIHKTVRDFHSKHYVASAMTVGFESNLDLDSQEKLILECFSNVPEGNRKILRETPPTASEKRIGGKSYNMDYVLQGLCNFSNLWVVWPIPEAFLTKQGNKSMDVLLKVLGDDREGGLAHYLTSNQYVWAMIVNHRIGSYLMSSKYSSFVTIDFFLTPRGVAHVDHIMTATYSFLQELREIQDAKFRQVFNEMKLKVNRAQNQNRRQMKSGKFSSSVKLAKELQRLEPKNLLKTETWLWKEAVYVPGQVGAILKHLQPTNMAVVQTLPKMEKIREYMRGSKVYILPYSDAAYVVQGIKKRFGNLNGKLDSSQYNFRVLNENLQTAELALMMLPPVHYGAIVAQRLPLQNLWEAKVMHAVHYGNTLDNYQSVCFINYINSEALSTARNFAMSLIWITSTYFSLQAKYGSSVVFQLIPHSSGISIGVIGSSEQLHGQIESLNDQFFRKFISQEQINMAQAALITLYDLMYATNVGFITKDLLHFMTCNHSGDVLSDALAYIKDCSVEDVNSFIYSFKSKAMAFIAVVGNVSLQMANSVVDLINKQDRDFASKFALSQLFFTEYCRSESCHAYTKAMSPGEKCIRFKSDHCYSYTTTVTNMFYVGVYDPAKYVLWWNSLFFLRLRAFIELRMKQQLGYSVQAQFPRPKVGEQMTIGIQVTATAKKFSPCYLDKCMDQFMVDYGKFLETVDEETFRQLKEERGYDRTSVNVKIGDAKEWYEEHFGDVFASDSANKYQLLGMNKLSVQVLGNDCKTCNCRKCEEIEEWHRNDVWNHFQFAKGRDSQKDYFVEDPRKIRD